MNLYPRVAMTALLILMTVATSGASPPNIEITDPPPGALVSGDEIDVFATVRDHVALKVVRMFANGQLVAEVSPSEPTMELRIQASRVVLNADENVITIDAVNIIGRRSQVIQAVRRQTRSAPLQDPSLPRKHALIIGVNRYSGVAPLQFAERDARGMYDLLTTVGGYNAGNVLLLADHTPTLPTRANIRRAFDDLQRRVGKNDMVFVYFAGYGAREVDATAVAPLTGVMIDYIVPVDADPRRLSATALPVADFRSLFMRLQSERVVMVFDTCFTGLPGGRTFAFQLTRSMTMSREFAQQLLANRARVAIFASGPNETCQELSGEGHGLLTYFLLKGLAGAADSNGDRFITIKEIFAYVHREVVRRSHRSDLRQTPLMTGVAEDLPLIELASGQR